MLLEINTSMTFTGPMLSQRLVARKAGNDLSNHNDDTIIQAASGTDGNPDVLSFNNGPNKDGSMFVLQYVY